jgi:hypothetical protein
MAVVTVNSDPGSFRASWLPYSFLATESAAGLPHREAANPDAVAEGVRTPGPWSAAVLSGADEATGPATRAAAHAMVAASPQRVVRRKLDRTAAIGVLRVSPESTVFFVELSV